MAVCLEHSADLHMAQLMPLPLTVSCFSKIQIDFTFLVPAHPGSPGQRAVKRVCMCVLSRCACTRKNSHSIIVVIIQHLNFLHFLWSLASFLHSFFGLPLGLLPSTL